MQITWSFTKLAAVLILLSLVSSNARGVTSGASVILVTLVANIASTMLQQLYSVLALGGGYVLQRSWKPAAPKALDADRMATCNGPRTQVKLPM